jgi:hypothetical protein
VELCLDKRSIAGIEMRDLTIENSLSNGISVIAKKDGSGKSPVLADVLLQNVKLTGYGIGVKGKHGLFISGDAHGSLVIKDSNIPDVTIESDSFGIVRYSYVK